MARLLILLCLLLAAAAPAAGAPDLASGPMRACAPGQGCRPADLRTLSLDGPETRIEQELHVRPGALPLKRPLMVSIIAMASSEIVWNGSTIGRNGMPGRDSASETPGRFIASFAVPAELVRPGANTLEVRLSAHHLWLPVRRAVHVIEVRYYESPELPGLDDYLPALLALGALAAAFLYFAAAFLLDRGDRLALLAAGIAAAAMLQLGVETARSFVSYSYPWHLIRVAAIALLAAANATLIAAYAARRFAPAWRRTAPLLTLAAGLASLLLIPWYDLKAIAAIFAGGAALLACAASGARRGVPGARVAAGFALSLFFLIAWQRTGFLDRSWYLALAAALVALVAEQVLVLRQARSAGERESLRAAGLEERLRETMPAIARLKDGARTHQVPESSILYVRAADDYCEVRLDDGRDLLVTMSLAKLQQSLSDRFVRIHKSYAVNEARIASVAPRPGGGKQIALDDGTILPVGRAYLGAVAGLRAG